MEQGGKTVLATGIAYAKIGGTTLVWTPNSAGPLTVSVRYEKGDNVLADTSFGLVVAAIQEGVSLFFLAALGVVVLGVIFALARYFKYV